MTSFDADPDRFVTRLRLRLRLANGAETDGDTSFMRPAIESRRRDPTGPR